MCQISLTHFVDFVSTAGTPKLTVVKNAKNQLAKQYDPATDYYKVLRDGIIKTHQKGHPKSSLDEITNGLTDKKKIRWYPTLIRGYKRFLGNKKIEWFKPRNCTWSHAGLTVRVNPELGLTINGARHVVKLYFKAEKLANLRTRIITQLMELALLDDKVSTKFAILDVRNAKLFVSNPNDPNLIALLKGEAASFSEIFKTV